MDTLLHLWALETPCQSVVGALQPPAAGLHLQAPPPLPVQALHFRDRTGQDVSGAAGTRAWPLLPSMQRLPGAVFALHLPTELVPGLRLPYPVLLPAPFILHRYPYLLLPTLSQCLPPRGPTAPHPSPFCNSEHRCEGLRRAIYLVQSAQWGNLLGGRVGQGVIDEWF